jgi:peptide/nickel transport system permease protein
MLHFIPVLILASMAIWGMIYLIPGSPATIIAGPNGTPQEVRAISARLGLNRPIPVQYVIWVEHALRGDLGVSAFSGQPVTSLIASRLPATAQLAALSMIIALLVSVPLGILAGSRPRSWTRRFVDAYQATALAVPTFWLGILLIIFFGLYLKVLPTASNYVAFWQSPLGALKNTILPALTLGIFVSGILTRFLAGALTDALGRDYVRTARAKGVRERVIVLRHGLRNALLPFVTVTGLQLGGFVGGTIVTESVFSYPGLGSLIYQAVEGRDYALVQGTTLLIVVIFMLINLGVDVLYGVLDPRIRLS